MSLMAKLDGSWQDDIDGLRDAIIENVCALISSRAPIWSSVEGEANLVEGSIVHIGLSNTTRSQSKSNSDVLVADIAELIRLYEPRLAQVDIELNEQSVGSNQLQFRISAIMHSQQGDEAIVLDSLLDFSRNKLDVRKSNLV
ncbi:type VI secretion system baseplate subunit TssE [Photobacterium indicum]|jgi:type VI secretion system protein ImpF|uniref:Type VI secretion system baseplate subunit TssE n=1 Tax=Photobacterium indicum TaxID=81447 RepID=A0A2T3LCT9_9GAMM|nr:type VI secretion system baseplate subunit TssE [Photobacterium indicum]PSV49201.1 type VI secretion system baseplate subunit TssE [Photobacterium indicum]